MGSLRQALRLGVRHLREYPQVGFTALVALLVVGLFSYVIWSFSALAQRAYERTAEVRIGSLLDGVAFAAQWKREDPSVLEEALARIMATNDTLAALEVWVRPSQGQTYRRVAAVARQGFPGEVWARAKPIVGMALGDPLHQTYLTLEEVAGNRLYLAARALPAGDGYVRAALYLSEADVALSRQLFISYALTFALVLAVILLLFRVARITDYGILYERLREAEALKDRFFSLASHELRAPLTAVRGYLSLLAERLRAKEELELATRAQKAADLLLQLVNDLLDVSRLAEGRMSFSLRCVAVGEIVNEVAQTFQTLAKAKGLTLRIEGGEGVHAIADPVRLKQVLTNLVSNAIKYTEQGSVVIRAQRKEGEDSVSIEVEDTGIGMSAEEQRHLFERFYRSARQEVRREGGTGLGMWITRELVTRMHGSIAVESIEGRGTKVRVILPACSKPLQES